MISRNVVLEHPRMVLVEDTVELPDGKVTSYLRHMPAKTHSVAVIAVNEKQEILLQKEYSYPPNRVMWQLPGGGVKDGEDVTTAANRELSEEADVVGKNCQVIGSYYVNNRRSDEKQYLVQCTDLESKSGKRDDVEFLENQWVPISELRGMIAKGEFDNMYLLAALNVWFSSRGDG